MPQDCVFCRIVRGEVQAWKVHEDDLTIVFLDSGPLFAGHCLVCPKDHYDTLLDVPNDLLEPLFATAKLIGAAVERGLGAQGSFMAINNRISQSVPHLHLHVVPRRRQDGLKGFFWPRRPYRDESEAADTQKALQQAVADLLGTRSTFG